jgi:hypothetical protein
MLVISGLETNPMPRVMRSPSVIVKALSDVISLRAGSNLRWGDSRVQERGALLAGHELVDGVGRLELVDTESGELVAHGLDE